MSYKSIDLGNSVILDLHVETLQKGHREIGLRPCEYDMI